MNKKILYYIPVDEKYLDKWEYYQVDLEILKKISGNVVVCTSIYKIFKNLSGSNLIFCWWWHRSTPVILMAKIFRIRTMVTGAIHMYDLSGSPDFYTKSFLYRLSSKLALKWADYNLFISRDQYLQVTSHAEVNNPLLIKSSLNVGPKLDLETLKSSIGLTSKGGGGKQVNKFLSITWHTLDQYKRKGIFETLDAFSLLSANTKFNFEWNIIGADGDGLSLLRKKIKALGLEENVFIHLNVPQNEKRKWFLKSDLYIQPSWCEGFGNAVLEAMSHGLPALVSRYTAQPEVVGDTGFVTMEMDAESIRDALMLYLEMSDADKKNLQQKVIDRVNNKFSFDRRFNEIRRLCEKI